jgi:hypothetical protein
VAEILPGYGTGPMLIMLSVNSVFRLTPNTWPQTVALLSIYPVDGRGPSAARCTAGDSAPEFSPAFRVLLRVDSVDRTATEPIGLGLSAFVRVPNQRPRFGRDAAIHSAARTSLISCCAAQAPRSWRRSAAAMRSGNWSGVQAKTGAPRAATRADRSGW